MLWWGQDRSLRKTESIPSKPPAEAPSLPISPEPKTSVIPEAPRPPNEPSAIPPQEYQLILDAIDNLEFAFRDFSTALGGNPVGTNAEITAALLGDNLKQVKLPIPAGSTRNAQGELCDPWGSPWFFHQLSGKVMEIRSAGPDRRMWNEDDIVRK